jgi:hypothetical protein
MDPSPFQERDLDHDAEEFIVDWVREFPRRDPVSLVIHVNQTPARPDAQPYACGSAHTGIDKGTLWPRNRSAGGPDHRI